MEQKVCSLTIRGETKQYPLDTTFQQIADEYQKQFENKIVLVKFQNDLKELMAVWNLLPQIRNQARIRIAEV